MTTAGTPGISRAARPLVAGALLCAVASGAGFAQHAYSVGPGGDYLERMHLGPVRSYTDADRSCLGGYNSETPYATDTCLRFGGGGFAMTRGFERPSKAPDVIARPIEIPTVIQSCWTPPPGPEEQVTIRLAFSAAGAPIGTPRITYVAAPDDKAKSALGASLLDAVRRCAPFRFTRTLGRAIAGRPFAIRFILPARS
ncbi:MAG: hypothetical protein KGM42_20160 [Hyphomicrobiales bacterium]|nr:hypothetical protein [Hyphomicrobiales bacterium]